MDLSALQRVLNTATANSIAKTSAVQVQSAAETTQTEPSKDSYDSQLQEIAKKYDVTHMTAQQVEQMAYELNEKGLISIGDFAGLAYTPYLMAEGDEATMQAVGADGCINLLNYWKGTITPSFAASGMELFNKLLADRQETVGNSKTASANSTTVAQSSLPATYRIAIDSSTRDYQRVGTLLEALAANVGTA